MKFLVKSIVYMSHKIYPCRADGPFPLYAGCAFRRCLVQNAVLESTVKGINQISKAWGNIFNTKVSETNERLTNHFEKIHGDRSLFFSSWSHSSWGTQRILTGFNRCLPLRPNNHEFNWIDNHDERGPLKIGVGFLLKSETISVSFEPGKRCLWKSLNLTYQLPITISEKNWLPSKLSPDIFVFMTQNFRPITEDHIIANRVL